MARPKLRVKQYQVAVNKEQQATLEKLMKEDLQTSVSQYFGIMIAEIAQWREEYKTKRAGRPKNEKEEEQVVWYKLPDGNNPSPYTYDEYTAYCIFNKQEQLPREQLELYDPSDL